jgi:hypothetical protein
MRHHRIALGAVALVAALPLMPSASAVPGHHSQTFSVPFTFSLDVTIDCQHTGNTVTIDGPIGLGGSAAHVWYQNNVKGTKQSTVYSGIIEAAIAPVGGSVHLVKQPSKTNEDGQYGSGGNPWIWYDAGDGLGPQLVGRCVSASYNVSKHFGGTRTVTVDLVDTLTALDCSKTNASVHLNHHQQNPAVEGTLMFDNNVNKPTHPSDHAASLTVGLTGATSLDKANDIKAGMGNPLVYLTAGDSLGDATATQAAGGGTNFGHCNQLY